LNTNDPGLEGAPESITQSNEQDCILIHYLHKWNYLWSAHTVWKLVLHSQPSYVSKAHAAIALMQQLLTLLPKQIVASFEKW